MNLKDKIREYVVGTDSEKNTLDALFDKALEAEGIERTALLIASGMMDYLAATPDESRRHWELVDDNKEDRTAYCRANMLLGTGGEMAVAIKLSIKCPPLAYALLADTVMHVLYGCVDLARGENYSRMVGFVGTARSFGYKLAGKLRRGEDEAELESEPEIEEDAKPEEEVRAHSIFPPVFLPKTEDEIEEEDVQ